MSTERRFPGSVFGVGSEPDARFSLANERTFLAWIRTSIAFMAAGVALEALPVPYPQSLQSALAVALLVIGIVASGSAWLRWALTERAMRRGDPLPSLSLPLFLAMGIAACAVVLLVARL